MLLQLQLQQEGTIVSHTNVGQHMYRLGVENVTNGATWVSTSVPESIVGTGEASDADGKRREKGKLEYCGGRDQRLNVT